MDTTLERRADNSVAPIATAVELAFSGGGTGPLATIAAADGRSLSMSWPGTLPTPSLDGPVATYAEVLPGVDLQITATVTGFSELLVVKNAEAAADTALTQLRFDLNTEGVSLRKAADGVTEAVADGAVLFSSPAPRMWDASGRKQATMATSVSTASIALTPDKALLDDPGVRYPIYIDPEWNGSRLAWAMVSSDGSYTGWNLSHRSEAGTYDGSVKRRSFYRMNTDRVVGKHVIKATFRIDETWSWSCSARPIEFWHTGAISQSTTWSKQPTMKRKLDELNVAKGFSSSCPSGPLAFEATAAVVDSAAKGQQDTTFGLIAGNESDTFGWKGFDQTSASLEIDYNSVPSRPAAMATVPGTPCVTGTSRPAVSTLTPTLRAKIYDPDKTGDGVRAEFDVNVYSGGAWTDLYVKNTSYVASADPVAHQVGLTGLTQGGVYAWRIRAYDGLDGGAWSPWCEFRVDTVVPADTPTVTSAAYPSDQPQLSGVGRPGSFTFTRASGDTDVVAFDYAVNDLSARRRVQAPSGTVSVLIAPPRDFVNAVYVWPIDAAGNAGPYATYTFDVSFVVDGPVSSWSMDEANTSPTAADAIGGRTLNATGVTFTGGRSVKAAQLNGTSSYLSSSGTVLDTGKAFTVAAWAQVTNDTHVNTIASQNGNRASGFQLYYNHGDQKWTFGRRPSDADGVQPVKAVSDAPARQNAWEHVVGVYDPDAKQLRLYVNGRLQATQPSFTTPWNATGDFQVGRMKIDGVLGNYFTGMIDEVRVWDRIVYPHEVADLVNRPVQHQVFWRFNEGAGTSAATSTSQSGRTATLYGGAGWTTDGHEGNALSIPSSGQYAAASSFMTRTDGSFSAAVWVRRSAFGTTNTALSQDGSRRSGFTLGFRGGKWSFDVPASDTDGAAFVSAAIDPAQWPTDADEWTLLVGVYDHPRAQLRLYLNNQKVAEVSGTSTWNATGATQIGRAKLTGASASPWLGELDDAHVYTGALSDEDVINLFFGF
ncbi:LamG domain-containing protein [Herbidospora sp. NEAU-GS84]|uniref:LamG domain-containing protein n=1 Tax=Herbidospora solisilvae TaxID=2696284 RepID=A0A7C9IZS8_9ACTN|nr:LamG domain-containing protein [Herbidospora solisilvae]NAS20107.1 LamG domain-containing protein [Herbidospora solisilvae]